MNIDIEVPIIPIVVNIYDLEIIVNECKSKEEFIDYLHFRINNYELLSSFDELDFLGLYKVKGNTKINMPTHTDNVVLQGQTTIFDIKYNYYDSCWLRHYPSKI